MTTNIDRNSNKLERREYRKLEDHIAAKWDQIHRDRPTMRAFAEAAGKELGLHLSGNHVSNATETIGRTWPSPNRMGIGGGKNASRERWRQVRADLLVLCDIVQKMYKSLGEPVPAQLHEIANRLASEAKEPVPQNGQMVVTNPVPEKKYR